MFETGTPLCPVVSFEKYISHLNPKNEYFFPRRSKKTVKESDSVWYDNMVVGQRMLGDKMKTLSISAELSYMYTNQSIRATTITILDECGYEARHIMAVSGHKSESSIRSYAAQTSLRKKKKMSETLSASSNDNKPCELAMTLLSLEDQKSPHSVKEDITPSAQLTPWH